MNGSFPLVCNPFLLKHRVLLYGRTVVEPRNPSASGVLEGLGQRTKLLPEAGSLLLVASSPCPSLPPLPPADGLGPGYRHTLFLVANVEILRNLYSLNSAEPGGNSIIQSAHKSVYQLTNLSLACPTILISQQEEVSDDSGSTGERSSGALSLESHPECSLSHGLWVAALRKAVLSRPLWSPFLCRCRPGH